MIKTLWRHIINLIGSCFCDVLLPTLEKTIPMRKAYTSGIKFKVATHEASPIGRRGLPPSSRGDVLKSVWGKSASGRGGTQTKCKELLQSSLSELDASLRNFLPQKNGFVHTVLLAYNKHHDLIIRPDDIWIAILSQLNAYVNANAEDLRSYFVAHEGQKALTLEYYDVTRYNIDFSMMARDFAGLLKENINDFTLYDVILPKFSTTTKNDVTICSVMMMSIMKAYFTYTCGLDCGIPSVTLKGTKADYGSILARLDRFDEMGPQAKAFTTLLRPIICQFMATFDAIAVGHEPNLDFWGKVCHEENMGSGPTYLSGWLTAFCVWDADGKWQGPDLDADHPKPEKEKQAADNTFDASIYGRISMEDIPVGFADVPVTVIDSGVSIPCMMVAGHVGARMSGSGDSMDTLQPEPHWFMFEVETVERWK